MENQGYEGPTSDPRSYDPHGMSEDKKREFLRWYCHGKHGIQE